MIRALFLVLLLATNAQAAPFLMADPYPATGTQPDAATVTVNGGSPLPCTLQSVAGGLQPKCDLASITTAGTYTLVMTVSKPAAIVNGTNTATVDQGSTASSAPFSYVLRAGAIGSPASPRVTP